MMRMRSIYVALVAASAGLAAAAAVLSAAPVGAQAPASPEAASTSAAAQRFPQPVRVGDLVGRDVIEPVESRVLLGRVVEVVRPSRGRESIVMTYGGTLGFGAREIAVPIDAMALLGAELEVLGYTPAQLRQFPTFTSTRTDVAILRPDDVIRMGLTRPSH